MRERGMRTADFAAAIHCSRPNVHSIFQRKSIDIQQLITISEVLEYDFLKLYHEEDTCHKYVLLVELDKMKLDEVENDKSIKIIQQWEMSK